MKRATHSVSGQSGFYGEDLAEPAVEALLAIPGAESFEPRQEWVYFAVGQEGVKGPTPGIRTEDQSSVFLASRK